MTTRCYRCEWALAYGAEILAAVAIPRVSERHDGDDNYLFDPEECDACSMLRMKEIRTEAAI